MTGTITSEAIMAELVGAAGNDRRRSTLARLKEGCDDAAASGALKLADIEREIVRLHGSKAGPRAQSISNERKLPLGMYHYVEARERERVATLPQVAKRINNGSGRGEDAVLRAIESGGLDMDARAVLRDFHDRHVLTVKALERAKKFLKTLRPAMDVAAFVEGRPQPVEEGSSSPPPPELLSALEDVVAAFGSDDRLSSVGLVNDGGRIRRKTGTRDELFSPRTVENLASLRERFRV